MDRREIVQRFWERGILLQPGALDLAEGLEPEALDAFLDDLVARGIQVAGEDDLQVQARKILPDAPVAEVEIRTELPTAGSDSRVDYLKHFQNRFDRLASVIRRRENFEQSSPIVEIRSGSKEKSTMVGMIFDISTSPRGHLIVGVEDGTGRLPVLFPKNSEAAKTARTLVLDEVIGVHGRYRSDKGVLVASEVVFPDIDDQTGDLAKEPVVAAFLSDLHYGSDDFMGDAFDNFLSWINGRWGSQDERELAAITRYVLICGDLVERGADLLERYSRLAGLLDEIPREVAIVAIPGEEDTSGVIEPQRGFLEDAARAFSELERFHSGPNPSMVSLSSVPVLLYHGRSLEDWGSTLQGYSTCELMREMLLRRHIAPTYGSAVPIWPTGQDPFIIGEVPRIFHVGHGHKSCTAEYKGVRLITTPSWRSSDRGEGAGGVYLVDLSNLGVRELKFGNQ